MAEPADEMHVSLTDCRGRNHDGENSHEYSSPVVSAPPESPKSLDHELLGSLVPLKLPDCKSLVKSSDSFGGPDSLRHLEWLHLKTPEVMTYPMDLGEKLREIRQRICESWEIESQSCMRILRRYIAFESQFRKLRLRRDEKAELRNVRRELIQQDLETALTPIRRSRYRESNGHNFDITLLDRTQETCTEFLRTVTRHIIALQNYQHAMRESSYGKAKIQESKAKIQEIKAKIQEIFLHLRVESSDSKAKIQEIKAKIQDKLNYNGNCNVKIGIIPEGSGTPFLRWVYSGRLQWSKKFILTQLVLRLTGAKHISREYDITSIVSKLSTSEVIVLPRGF